MSLGLTRLGICIRPARPGAVAAPTRVPATAPVNTAPPAILGDPVDGNTLVATAGDWSGTQPMTYEYEWRANYIPIGGATALTYTLNGNAGSSVAVKVTAKNAAGEDYAFSAAVQVSPMAVPPAPDMSGPMIAPPAPDMSQPPFPTPPGSTHGTQVPTPVDEV